MTETCTLCNQPYPPSELVNFDSQCLCPACLESSTELCAHCDTRIWREEGCDTALCQACQTELYTTCTVCGSPIPYTSAYYDEDDENEEYSYCWVCFNQIQTEKKIHAYSYKPDPIFYGTGDRYFGVELELDYAGESSENACQIMRQANRGKELLYCKHDGSLEDGFELVTHPMTLDYHCNSMSWQDVFDEAVSLGYLSHKADTCGLHVHVNRTAFGETEYQQEVAIARVLYIMEKFWDELLKFSRRTQRQLDKWAARYGYKEHPMDILDQAKEGYGKGRYYAVNLQNRHTIEFRIFRGTLKYNTLIATLQLVNKICDVAISVPDGQLKALAWTTSVEEVQEPELIQYLKEWRLYINEPVEKGEEI